MEAWDVFIQSSVIQEVNSGNMSHTRNCYFPANQASTLFFFFFKSNKGREMSWWGEGKS